MQNSQPTTVRVPLVFQMTTLEETLKSFAWFAEMRKNAPVISTEDQRLWEVFRYEDVLRVMTDYASFSSEDIPGFSDSTFLKETVVAKDPPAHRKSRNLVNMAFTPRAINHLENNIRRVTQELLDKHLQTGHMDVVSDIAFPLPARVIAAMLGVPDEDWDVFRRWAGDPDRQNVMPVSREEAIRAHHDGERQMYSYFSALLEERRRNPREDLISVLSVAEIDGERLSESELVNFCLLLLAAGQETTKNLIANAIYCFTEYPEATQQLIEKPDLLPGAIEEVLRYMPPVWFSYRRTNQAVELGGQTIPANSVIQAWQASANRDPAQFANPDVFDIHREANRHITFGHGIHFCIGAPLARLEARVVLSMMLKQLKGLQLRSHDPIKVKTGIVYVIQSLPISFTAA